jgi:hypothetical protein
MESTTTRAAGGLNFTAIGGKRQWHEVPQSLRVKPGAKHPVWKTQSSEQIVAHSVLFQIKIRNQSFRQSARGALFEYLMYTDGIRVSSAASNASYFLLNKFKPFANWLNLCYKSLIIETTHLNK